MSTPIEGAECMKQCMASEGHKDLGQYPCMSKLRICWPPHVNCGLCTGNQIL